MAITANVTTANWNTNGAWVGSVQPTAADDVIIPSGAVITIPTATTVLGRSLDLQSGATLAFASTTAVLTLGDATAGAGNVALNVSSGSTLTLTGIGTINFATSSTTQQTITTGGKTMPALNFGSASGNCNLLQGDALTASGNISLTRGTWDTGNYAVTANGQIFGSGSNARTITMGSSAITAAGGTNAFNFSTITSLTVTANTAVITVSGDRIIQNGTLNWNGASFVVTGSGIVQSTGGTLTCKDFTRTGGANVTSTMLMGLNITCTGTFTATGNSAAPNRLLVTSDTLGTARTITAATVSLTNVDFQDITAAGAASPFTGTSLGNCLGNTNITFDTPITCYCVGSAGTKLHSEDIWKTTSGGGVSARRPLPQDDIVIDTNTAVTDLRADYPRMGTNVSINKSACVFRPTAASYAIYGNYTITSVSSLASSQSGNFAGRGTHTITSGGYAHAGSLNITSAGGTYTLQDAFSVAANSFSVNQGSFNSGNYSITLGFFFGTGTATRSITLGTSTVTSTITSANTFWSMTSTGVTLSAASSTITLSNTSANTRTFAGAGLTYGTLTYTLAGSTGQLNITGANTFGTINFSDVTNARTLAFTAATTTTVTNFNVNGTSGKLMSVNSITAATHTLSKPSGTVSCDYLSLTNSIATGGASWYAGANSTDVSGNTGWIFTAPVTASKLLTLVGVG